jgi:isopentenyl diphosphate isomerase/L-lactate dehydrogenase-like FMN-dependent dehydrogenase
MDLSVIRYKANRCARRRGTMSEEPLTISQIYAKGRESLKLQRAGADAERASVFPSIAPTVRANRQYLDSLFYETRLFDPVEVDTSLNLFNVELKTPAFCSAISGRGIAEIAGGISNSGSLMMLGISRSDDLQGAIDTGAPVVKIVKPYRNTEVIYEETREAESRGCVAVGMDIDHFYGASIGGRVLRAEQFGPQRTEDLRQLISQTALPFIIKGVLSVRDAEKALALGASAIVVSNHASGSFNFSVPSMMALPKIVKSVGAKLTVLVDSGFENGEDVFKALAFGAKAVGFGSSMVLALAADGSGGVELLVNQITAQLARTMAATGCADLSAIDKSLITEVPFTRE